MFVFSSRIFDPTEANPNENRPKIDAYIHASPAGDNLDTQNQNGIFVPFCNDLNKLKEQISDSIGGGRVVSALSFLDGTRLEPQHMSIIKPGITLFYHLAAADPFSFSSLSQSVKEKCFTFNLNEKTGIVFNNQMQVVSISGQAENLGVKIGSKLIKIGVIAVTNKEQLVGLCLHASTLEFYFHEKIEKSRSSSHLRRNEKATSIKREIALESENIEKIQEKIEEIDKKIENLQCKDKIVNNQIGSDDNKQFELLTKEKEELLTQITEIENLINEKQLILKNDRNIRSRGTTIIDINPNENENNSKSTLTKSNISQLINQISN
eukprot:c15990_g1_i1.p1 GENE.c15990_g1_i1~~c15990_g1_i1.p1  ORF type:complete len:323 (+),score=125.71 c15990_g1_i1:86-1054(+)